MPHQRWMAGGTSPLFIYVCTLSTVPCCSASQCCHCFFFTVFHKFLIPLYFFAVLLQFLHFHMWRVSNAAAVLHHYCHAVAWNSFDFSPRTLLSVIWNFCTELSEKLAQKGMAESARYYASSGLILNFEFFKVRKLGLWWDLNLLLELFSDMPDPECWLSEHYNFGSQLF